MLLYNDIITGDELISDAYDVSTAPSTEPWRLEAQREWTETARRRLATERTLFITLSPTPDTGLSSYRASAEASRVLPRRLSGS